MGMGMLVTVETVNTTDAIVVRGWLQPHDDMLTALKAEGKSSRIIMDLINQAFGTAYTRNSVIGRSHRLGLQTAPLSESKPRSDGKGAPGLIKTRKRRSLPPLALPKFECSVVPFNIELEDLRSFHCREPYEQADAATTYCGHTKQPGSSYCAAHHSKNMNTWRRA